MKMVIPVRLKMVLFFSRRIFRYNLLVAGMLLMIAVSLVRFML